VLKKFLADFDRVKTNLLDVTHRFNDTVYRVNHLEGVVSRLNSENIKVKSEMTILRDEHSEVLHNMF
jgi:hypothetical protein